MAYDYNYMGLVNKVLKDLNEVQLTSLTFDNAVGFHAAVKDYINDAIQDIYEWEDTEWPFAWDSLTFTTTIGQVLYTKDATLTSVDWDSFAIEQPSIPVSSLTHLAGLATVVTSVPHQLRTNDKVTIRGADQSSYNGEFQVTVIDSVTFTISVSSSLVSPATGTITASPDYASEKLSYLDYDEYRKYGAGKDNDAKDQDDYSKPYYVIRQSDNNFFISPKADRVYTIKYEGFILPTDLDAAEDVPEIPVAFKQVIIDKALHYAYMFRDNIEQANLVMDRFEKSVKRMRRILIPQTEYMRWL